MSRAEKALSYFAKGFNCSQAVLSSFGPDWGLDSDSALKIATPFGGGVAGLGRTCGAVSGALMAIGLKCGTTNAGNRESKQRVYELGRLFIARFEAEYGSANCSDLLGCHIDTEAGMEHARSHNLFRTVCPRYVKGAVDIAESILQLPSSKGEVSQQ